MFVMKKYYFDKDGTSNFQMAQISKENGININIEDVMMMDQLKNVKLKKKINLVLNLQDTGQSGSHWFSVLFRGQNVLVIDSYGCYPHMDIIQYCRNHKLKLGYSSYICQSNKSNRCGLFTLQSIKYLQNSNESNLYKHANDYVNLYGPLSLNTNEDIAIEGLVF